ncbi:pyocin knob domain-containing protein, partial [Rodentibacter caecimuris]
MQLKLIDLFESIRWAKNGDLTDFSQTNYEAGWAHLGDDTPTVQDFNYVQAMNDQKDQWLFAQINEVLKAQGIEATEEDLPALKRAIENLVTAKSTPKTITAETQNGFDESGHTHEIDRATTAKAGIVQLSNDDNSDDETKAPTLKAIKKLKGLYDGLRRLLDSYIPNSKKSNAVNSPSSDTIATSAAAKTAYDKGAEAKNAADNANNNANRRAFGLALSSEDLNNVTASGIYGQNANINATPARHYPIQQAGMLLVTEHSGYGAQQLYVPYNAGYLYARGRNASNGWDDWKRIDGLDKVSKSGDTMTGNLVIDTDDSLLKGKR